MAAAEEDRREDAEKGPGGGQAAEAGGVGARGARAGWRRSSRSSRSRTSRPYRSTRATTTRRPTTPTPTARTRPSKALLANLDLVRFLDTFRENEVDAASLPKLTKIADLAEMRIPIGAAAHPRRAARDRRPSPAAAAEEPRRRGRRNRAVIRAHGYPWTQRV